MKRHIYNLLGFAPPTGYRWLRKGDYYWPTDIYFDGSNIYSILKYNTETDLINAGQIMYNHVNGCSGGYCRKL